MNATPDGFDLLFFNFFYRLLCLKTPTPCQLFGPARSENLSYYHQIFLFFSPVLTFLFSRAGWWKCRQIGNLSFTSSQKNKKKSKSRHMLYVLYVWGVVGIEGKKLIDLLWTVRRFPTDKTIERTLP